ncbi:hypothetical protein [Burkholderia sp. Ax-1724]|uniref:hypothetical protein n=1 Tax=Burkholderia sp. Ax-1724 TaxID=2608336 RepID=UPI00142017DB|nr:hypothetical protein [Burkholderia sp. Ax-1724]NIF55558.1 hypothetical protein [Burkholderia sp. Ax-1724]
MNHTLKFDGVFREELTHEPDTWIAKALFNAPIDHFNDRERHQRMVAAEYFEETAEEMAIWMHNNSEGKLKFERSFNFHEGQAELAATLTFHDMSEFVLFAMEYSVERHGIGNTVSCLPDILKKTLGNSTE